MANLTKAQADELMKVVNSASNEVQAKINKLIGVPNDGEKAEQMDVVFNAASRMFHEAYKLWSKCEE